MGQTELAANDRLLAPWLSAVSEAVSDERLPQLIADELEPVISGVIRFKLRLDSAAADAEDLKQEALAELWPQLLLCRAQPLAHAIGDVRGLAATITYRVCYRWLRRQSPQRNALRNRLQYVLTRAPALALWPDATQKLLSGLAAWRERYPDAMQAAERESSSTS